MAVNDVTGDRLVSSVPTDKYREGYDAIFGKAVPSYESICLDTSSEYLAKCSAVIRDYWETPEDMWERLDRLGEEYKGK